MMANFKKNKRAGKGLYGEHIRQAAHNKSAKQEKTAAALLEHIENSPSSGQTQMPHV